MTKQIFDGVCKAIAEGFELPVYTERVMQNSSRPCFAVRLEKAEEELFFGKKYILRQRFKITYFDDTAGDHMNAVNIVEKLCDILKYLDYGGGAVHGSGMKFELKENRLEMYVDYNVFVYRFEEGGEESGIMETLDIDWDI